MQCSQLAALNCWSLAACLHHSLKIEEAAQGTEGLAHAPAVLSLAVGGGHGLPLHERSQDAFMDQVVHNPLSGPQNAAVRCRLGPAVRVLHMTTVDKCMGLQP